ncbi:MAG: AAA family ATPase [Candidatus Saccharibacteria bacterium]|nr:AAA family ATPase [Candidatus Saccharibacteria bacterium]
MIKRFDSLNKISVFNNFTWSSSVTKDGNPVDLKKINIIFGRNYSGKTTLSRIVRTLETKNISAYENPEFNLTFDDGSVIDQVNYRDNNKIIRVFNEDFVKENLAFISNPTESIKSFAILGANTTIEQQINELKAELGNCIEGTEFTGLYKIKQDAEISLNTISEKLTTAKNELEGDLKRKATGDKNNSIKYQVKYGDINYTVQKLKNELGLVLDSNDYTLTPESIQEKESLIKEVSKTIVPKYTFPSTNFANLQNRTKELTERKLIQSSKIEELVKNAILGNWVKEGIDLNKGRETCAFCGNKISSSRWHDLECHFDETSKQLEQDINSTINDISSRIREYENLQYLSKDHFYEKQHYNFHLLENEFREAKSAILAHLNNLVQILENRKTDLLNPHEYTLSHTFSHESIDNLVSNTNQLINEVNNISKNLSEQQIQAKRTLRLNAVKEFSDTLNYKKRLEEIEELSDNVRSAIDACESAKNNVKTKLLEIKQLEAQLNDESLGAEKVNEYLNNFFGHKYLHLEAIKDSPEAISTRFEIQRNGSIAKNMSEGECRLVAFCYFMAKLEDNQTKGTSPIIWIDDPICSLDSNHIFFIYSLINVEIVKKENFAQLTISTHNLDFLKYTLRLGKDRLYLIIERVNDTSKIKLMPRYMSNTISEFCYLFHQIHRCATIETVDDSNYTLFYNFGNNARKFLELYLFYKYPGMPNDERYKKFFGDTITTSVLNRLNNEYSHLCGVFERGERLVDIPEISTVAKAIVDKIQEKDPEQYNSLIACIS